MRIFQIPIIVIFAAVSCLAQNIMVNQIGYLTNREKIVYFTQAADSFFVVQVSSGDTLFRAKTQGPKVNDPATGTDVYYGDFTTLDATGNYVIKTNTGETSYQFEISANPFTPLYKASLKGFYYQRCGVALLFDYAGKYSRPACHLQDALFDPSTGKSGSKDETGGWHDAGDYGKYVVNAGVTVGTMLMGYELFPNNFISDDLNIPESGNSVPDLLDEIKFELDWMFKMQDTDGGVFFKVTPHNFSGFIKANTDNSVRYIFQKSSTATGDFAAVMAMAARIYKPFDTAFSSECLTAAEKAWQYLSNNPTIVPAGGFHNPSGTVTGEYGDGNDKDERLWAAVELFNTTGDTQYDKYYLQNYQTSGMINSYLSWPNVTDLAHLDYLFSAQPGADSSVKASIRSSLDNTCKDLVNISQNDGFNVTLNKTGYFWGSNSSVLNNAVILIAGYRVTGNSDFYNTALKQFNYILGANINDICYVTDLGTKFPMHIHHRPSASDTVLKPVPGLLAGGPNENITNDPVLQARFTSATPPAKCYADDQGSYASNEIAINWNSPLVFVSGYFSGEKIVEGVKKSTGSIPDKIKIEQNYPNPFNPATVITYEVYRTSKVNLTVFNSLGQQVAVLVGNSIEYPGKYSITWNGRNNKGEIMTSGIYFYQLKTGSLSQTKKMVLLR